MVWLGLIPKQVRMDQMAHLLHYPQKPLGITRSMTYLHFRELPSGFNAVVAIMIYSGYNQEDSLIQNMSAHDLGLFRSSYFKCFQEKEAKKTGYDSSSCFDLQSLACLVSIFMDGLYFCYLTVRLIDVH